MSESQTLECPPTPSKSLTCFSEVPDQRTPGPGCQLQQGLICAVLAALALRPPLYAGCKDTPAQGIAATGSAGRRAGPYESIPAPEASPFLHPESPRRSCSGPGSDF